MIFNDLPKEMKFLIYSKLIPNFSSPEGGKEAGRQLTLLALISTQAREILSESCIELRKQYLSVTYGDIYQKPLVIGFRPVPSEYSGIALNALHLWDEKKNIFWEEQTIHRDFRDIIRLFPDSLKCAVGSIEDVGSRLTPLAMAAFYPFPFVPVETIQLMLEAGADPQQRIDVYKDDGPEYYELRNKSIIEGLEILRENGLALRSASNRSQERFIALRTLFSATSKTTTPTVALFEPTVAHLIGGEANSKPVDVTPSATEPQFDAVVPSTDKVPHLTPEERRQNDIRRQFAHIPQVVKDSSNEQVFQETPYTLEKLPITLLHTLPIDAAEMTQPIMRGVCQLGKRSIPFIAVRVQSSDEKSLDAVILLHESIESVESGNTQNLWAYTMEGTNTPIFSPASFTNVKDGTFMEEKRQQIQKINQLLKGESVQVDESNRFWCISNFLKKS